MIVGWPLIPKSSIGWCEMNEKRLGKKECGRWVEIIIERHWSSLFPWHYSIISLICIGGSWYTHTHPVLIVIGGFGSQCLRGFLCTFQTEFQPCCSCGKDRQTCTLWAGSIPQPRLSSQRGRSVPQPAQIFTETLWSKTPTAVFNAFLNVLERSHSTKMEKYELVLKVVWKICNRVKRVKSKKWANLLWIHCKSDTALLKQYKNLIK